MMLDSQEQYAEAMKVIQGQEVRLSLMRSALVSTGATVDEVDAAMKSLTVYHDTLLHDVNEFEKRRIRQSIEHREQHT